MNFKEIDGNGTVEGFVLVKHCDKKTAKNGSHYLDLSLADKSGEIVAKMWDFREGNFLPENNSIIKVRGVISSYNGTPMKAQFDGKYYWLQDKAGHGNSAFKVFKKSGNKLNWVYDADEFGNFILNKHKGPIGLVLNIGG